MSDFESLDEIYISSLKELIEIFESLSEPDDEFEKNERQEFINDLKSKIELIENESLE